MNAGPRILISFLAAAAWSLGFWTATTHSSAGAVLQTSSAPSRSVSAEIDPAQSGAVCPVVYQLDQSPSSRGYHYQFFGNAFFINDQGYLLTDAHVLETFRDGGQPYILVNRRESPPQLLQVQIIATDRARDVAILRAEPNPFSGRFRVAYFTLSEQPAVAGDSVIALSLHPAHPRSAQSFQAPREDRSPGQILSFQSTVLDPSASPSDVFLLSHPVELGQSGSPVLALTHSASTGAPLAPVVGLIEGRWLRGSPAENAHSNPATGDVPGAALPIAYAIDLLERKHVLWHSGAAARP
ncbi:MAG TPA: serine protease [Candidatus Acidoferrales bacterium]|nr:serine protease [Candidatus Acidoferrales bacterium]